jgi:TetR/AcrR family transcriptional repressor of nem operon
MRYPASHKHETHARIVRAASRRFRRRGASGAAIGDLMRDLRLTHGGFYRHFAGKDDLFTEAFGLGLQDTRERIGSALARAQPGQELQAFIDAYLDVEHCENVADGCPLAALGSEVARRPHASRTPFERALADHIHLMAKHLPGETKAEREQRAALLLAGMSGTLTLARVITDDARRRKLLNAARAFYLRAARR